MSEFPLIQSGAPNMYPCSSSSSADKADSR